MPTPYRPSPTPSATHRLDDAVRSGNPQFARMQRMTLDVEAAETQQLAIIDVADPSTGCGVRFERGEVDGQPGVVMQEQRDDGSWEEIWSMPTKSADAREGMIGWLNTQSRRWDKFARMLHRRGPDELTDWIFEMMVVPSTHEARPPRHEPPPHTTIDYYTSAAPRPTWSPHLNAALHTATRHRHARAYDDCACRASGIQSTRDF